MYFCGEIVSESPKYNELFLQNEQITEYYINVFADIPKNIKPYNGTVRWCSSTLKLLRLFKIETDNYNCKKNSDDTYNLSNNTGELIQYTDCGIYEIEDIPINMISISDKDISTDCMIKCRQSIQYMLNCCINCFVEPHIILRTQNLKGQIEHGFNETTGKIFYDIVMDYFLSDDYDPNTFSFDDYYRTRTYLRQMYKLDTPQCEDKNYFYKT